MSDRKSPNLLNIDVPLSENISDLQVEVLLSEQPEDVIETETFVPSVEVVFGVFQELGDLGMVAG